MAEHTTQDLGASLTLLLRAVMRVRDRFRAEAVRSGLDWSAYVVLRPLVESGPRRLTTLAEAMKLSPSTVSRLVTHMITEGLLERRPDPDDGRAGIIAPTDRGVRTYTELRRVRDDYVAQLLGDWSDHDRSELVRLVGRLASALEADSSDRGPSRLAPRWRRELVVPDTTTGVPDVVPTLPAALGAAAQGGAAQSSSAQGSSAHGSVAPPGTSPDSPLACSDDLAWTDLR
jgi:DNA-binding MarR family transcriptional regulator